VLLAQAFPPPRPFREHDHDLALADQLDRAADRLDVGLAAPDRKGAAGVEKLRQHREEQLALRHEPELPAREERQPEWPWVEVRRVVRGEHETALREVLDAPRAQAENGLHEGPAERGDKKVNRGQGANGSFHFRLSYALLRRSSPSLLCFA
jgi:hypothetical protein